MIKIENAYVCGWESAIRGLRNPMNSWAKSDTSYYYDDDGFKCDIGYNDLDLMKRLAKAGTDHRKFMRFINITMDVTAPLYWWKEYDTYKVGTVSNSCSTMHKIHEKEFTMDDFSTDKMDRRAIDVMGVVIRYLNVYRNLYNETKEKKYWYSMIQLLPSSYNQRRTILLNYEVLANMYKSRKNHKLDEWVSFCKWIETLPYSELIMGRGEK